MSSSDEEVVAAAVKPKAKGQDWSGSDDESDWTDSDDESDSSSDFDSDEGTGGEGEFARYTIAYFLKRPEGPKKRSEQEKKKPRKQRETKKEKNDDDDWEKVQAKNEGKGMISASGKIQIFAKGKHTSLPNNTGRYAARTLSIGRGRYAAPTPVLYTGVIENK